MKKSFTLIELLIVIAIVAIIAVGIIILTIPGERLAQARDATRAAHLKNLETALYLYNLDNELSNLEITENLTEICNTGLGEGCDGLIDLSALNITIPIDPLGGNSPNGTGYYLALINNKVVLYATKGETKETKIGIEMPEGAIFIYNWYDLNGIRDDLDGYYILMNNLSSATNGYSIYNTGDGWLPIGNDTTPFAGTFDGNGKIISNLIIDRPGTNDIGLFGYTSTDSLIKNIGLVDNDINGNNMVGTLVGYHMGTITNVYNTGTVSGDGFIGGITGKVDTIGTITNVYNTGDILITGRSVAGGIAGNIDGTITNAYNTGTVSGGATLGGITGLLGTYSGPSGTIINSYNTANISGDYYVGGIAGLVDNGTITNAYNTGDISASLGFGYGAIVGYVEVLSITNSYFSAGFNNGYGIEELEETNFYSQTHNVYILEEPNWSSPPWSWLLNDFPKLDI